MTCPHPYKRVRTVMSDPPCCIDCDGPGEFHFAFCLDCKEIVEGECPNPIPWDWNNEARREAAEITGFQIGEPPAPSRASIRPGMADVVDELITRVYTPKAIEELKNLCAPIYTEVPKR